MFTGIVILLFMMLLPALFSLYMLSETGIVLQTLMITILMGALFLTFASVVTALGIYCIGDNAVFLLNQIVSMKEMIEQRKSESK